jgi:hypothetical protein
LFLGLVSLACAIVVGVSTSRNKAPIAAEVSNFYDTRIRGGELPVMNAASFDRWAARRGLQK